MFHYRVYTDDHKKEVIFQGCTNEMGCIMDGYLETIGAQHADGDWRPLRLEVSEERFDEVLDSLE